VGHFQDLAAWQIQQFSRFFLLPAFAEIIGQVDRTYTPDGMTSLS
jgi:hypothetical protein